MEKRLSGKTAAKEIRQAVGSQVEIFEIKHLRRPKLVVILVGEDPASEIYVRNKHRACEKVGIISESRRYPDTATEADILDAIDNLNSDAMVDGILVQLPLPVHIDPDAVIHRIHPSKDVDGFHRENVGKLWLGCYHIAPCTPLGIIRLMEFHNIDVSGQNAVIAGRSNIVGKPLAALLLERNATVTIAHSKTRNLPETCRRADLLIAAIGKPGFFTRDYIRPGATVIDVGTSRVLAQDAPRLWRSPGSPLAESFDTKGECLVGDVDPLDVIDVAGRFTPVPGGVGPMTIAMLLQNTLKLATLRMG